MTPQEHLALAEQYASAAQKRYADGYEPFTDVVTQLALAHAVIALAAELGVPHATSAPAAVSGG